jgi:hypothetical protein
MAVLNARTRAVSETYIEKGNDGAEIEMTDVEFAGDVIGVPVQALDNPELLQKIFAHYRTTPEFDKTIDKQRGAPAMVRALVGSSSLPEDKLKNSVRLVAECPYP